MSQSVQGTNTISAELKGCDFLELSIFADGTSQFSVIGCSQMLACLRKNRSAHGPKVQQWPLPQGQTHAEVLLRELLLKARGQWQLPYSEAELCHCRLVPTEVVDQAIVGGAHTPEKVSRQTSASTACGTCRPEVEKIINYRLAK
jgi:bacterioferritin-associated ferredoxin